jgi:broad specificity phosphatase PhoE
VQTLSEVKLLVPAGTSCSHAGTTRDMPHVHQESTHRTADLVHEAMNPKWHRIIEGNRHGDVVVAGHYYAIRQALIARLLRDEVTFRLYGSAPPSWSRPEIRFR